MAAVVLFDGLCAFCDKSVQFIIKRDPAKYFSFAALESDVGEKLIAKYDIRYETDSFLLIDKGVCYEKSSAALHTTKHLKGFWKLCFIFIIVPKPLRDFLYDQFAKRRYKWFGNKKSCKLPTSEEKDRFL